MIPLATGTLVAAAWQGILLAILVGLGLGLLPKTPAAVRFAIWFVVFAVVTGLPVISLWAHASTAADPGGQAWLILSERWSLAIAAVWLTASLVRAVTLTMAALRVRALWKRAKPVGEGETGPGLRPMDVWGRFPRAEARSYSGKQRQAQVCTSDEVDRPTVIGFFAPKILIPTWLLEKLTPAELEQVVLHEAGHLGRADDWLNLLQKIALVIFPLNPALAWVERRLCFERELAVDERVLHACSGKVGAATAYASCLATLAEYRLERRRPRGLALVLGALGRESELGRRVMRILRRGESMKPVHARLVFGGAVVALLVGAAGLERCPQVIGFANGVAPLVAHGNQWQPTHSDETAMNGGPGDSNVLQRGVSTPHEVLLKATIPAKAELASAAGTTVARVDAAPVQGRLHGLPARMVKRQSPEVVAQWVVVTTYRGEGGAHVVMTTSRAVSESERASRTGQRTDFSNTGNQTGDEAGSQMAPSDVVPAYAAVPVRGGWLIFQL